MSTILCESCGNPIEGEILWDNGHPYHPNPEKPCPIAVAPPKPRTYEQGVAAGRKEMAEAACKAQCRWCAGRVTYDNGWHSDTVIHLRCESELIRRAAKELGVAL